MFCLFTPNFFSDPAMLITPLVTTQKRHLLFAEVSSLTHQMQTSNQASQTRKNVSQTTSHLLLSQTRMSLLPSLLDFHRVLRQVWETWLAWLICYEAWVGARVAG